ncbi:MAG: hypothetical protein ABMB14_30085 [Myxococcota bacterium]
MTDSAPTRPAEPVRRPEPPPRSEPAHKRGTGPRWFRDRDWPLLGLLAVLNIGSAYTTVLGARQILPYPMSDVLGFSVQGMLFLMLAGFAVRDAPVRKWVVVALFASASIYTSFFTYYGELAKEADQRQELDVALQTHATFVSAVYQPARSRIDMLSSEAEALLALAEREATRGSASGVTGYGPVAKKYAAEGAAKMVEAERLQADLNRLKDNFEFGMTVVEDGVTRDLTPDEVYQRDLAAWQLAPADWKQGVPVPVRTAYVDLQTQVALLTPYHRVMAGDLPAITALTLASLVDGIAIFLGTAIHSRQRRPVVESWTAQVASLIGQVKNSGAVIRTAFGRPGTPDAAREESLLNDALQVVDVRIAGRGSDFLTTFYQAIHPETGALDFSGLQRHPNPTYRIASRMLVDQLRSPQLGWVTVDDGWWSVPEEVYPEVTAWLGVHIRRECEAEAEASAQSGAEQSLEPERTLRLVIPAA